VFFGYPKTRECTLEDMAIIFDKDISIGNSLAEELNKTLSAEFFEPFLDMKITMYISIAILITESAQICWS
jgi:hypothetical protein